MDNYTKLISKFVKQEPFALVRFNDGEMGGIESVGFTAARGDQKVNRGLHDNLKRALEHRQEDYWIGKPCSRCFSQHRKLYDSIVPESYPYQTHATVLINNGRWWKSFDWFCEGISKRPVVWIGGESQDLTDFKERDVHIKQIRVPEQNGWSKYNELKNYKFNNGTVVVLSCGPMSRVLACDYYKANPNITVLDIGSLVDPLTRNVWFRCHTYNGGLKKCPEDNFNMEDERLIGKNKKDILEVIRS